MLMTKLVTLLPNEQITFLQKCCMVFMSAKISTTLLHILHFSFCLPTSVRDRANLVPRVSLSGEVGQRETLGTRLGLCWGEGKDPSPTGKLSRPVFVFLLFYPIPVDKNITKIATFLVISTGEACSWTGPLMSAYSVRLSPPRGLSGHLTTQRRLIGRLMSVLP